MIILSAVTQSIDLTTSVATTNPLEFFTAYVDVTTTTFTPVGFQGSGFSAGGGGTFSFLGAPASGVQRQIKYISTYNADTAAMTVTFSQNTSGTRRTLFKVTLAVGETLIYLNDCGWNVYNASGARKVVAGDVVGPSSATDNAIARFDLTTGKLIQNSLVTVDDTGNVVVPSLATVDGVDVSTIIIESSHTHGFVKSMLPSIAPAILISGTAYFVYLGQVKSAFTPTLISFPVTTIGAGAQTAECGFFSSPTAPTGFAQNMTKLVATATVDALTATGRKGNSVAFATVVAAGTHLWAGFRSAMVTTQPQAFGLTGDYSAGTVQTLAASGVLTGAGPFAATIPAFATTLTWLCPDIRMIY